MTNRIKQSDVAAIYWIVRAREHRRRQREWWVGLIACVTSVVLFGLFVAAVVYTAGMVQP